MRPEAEGTPIPRLLERLRRARSRARAALLLRAAVWLAVAAAAALLAGAVAAELGRPLPPSAGAWAGATLGMAALLALGLAWRRTPDLALLARRADARFGLRERAGTALELSRAGARRAAAGPLAAPLLRDAEEHADRIDPRRLVPLRLPRAALLALALAVATAAVQVVGLPRRVAPAPLPLPLTGAQAEVTSVNLRRAAELLERSAERSEDPYLQALARAFEELGRQVEAGTVDRAEVEREVDRLLEHAERAFEGEADSPLRAEEPSETAAREPRAAPADAPDPEAAAAAPTAEAPAEEAPRTEPAERTRGLADLDTFVEGLERIETAAQQEAAAREARAGRMTGAEFNYGFDRPEMPERRPDERRDPREVPPQDFVGVPIGAAEQANEGAGDLAGQGVMELAGEEEPAPDALLGGPDARTEEVFLPDAGTDGGERVQVELPPETRTTEVDGPAVAAAPPVAREAEVRRDLIGPRDREVVSRYFDRTTPRTSGAP